MYVPGDRLTSPEAAKVRKTTDEGVNDARAPVFGLSRTRKSFDPQLNAKS